MWPENWNAVVYGGRGSLGGAAARASYKLATRASGTAAASTSDPLAGHLLVRAAHRLRAWLEIACEQYHYLATVVGMELTIAEELLLLALHDEKGSTGFTSVNPGLSGALLMDLSRAGALRVADKKLEPAPGAAPSHPVLARTYGMLAESAKPRSASSWVGRLPTALKPIVATVAAPLVERGVLDEDRRKFLGLLPDTRYRESDPAPERQLRARLHAVLVGGQQPAEQDALLLGVLVPLSLVDGLVEKGERRAAKKRAKEIADQGVAGKAVHDAVQQEIMLAVMPAIAAGAVAGGSS